MYRHWQWVLRRFTRRLWFRASLFSLLGIVTALGALALKQYIPDSLPTKLGSDAVDNILSIIASSMLAVTTFSLSTMVSAYASATSSVTPRATSLLVEDSTTQNALATFIGSFLFSLVGIIALSTGAYGEKGRVVMFAATIGVIVLIVYTLLRWIDHLARLGRLGETTDRVEEAAARAVEERLKRPHLGGRALSAQTTIPAAARYIYSSKVGYVQHIDMLALAAVTKSTDSAIYVFATPGAFVEPTVPIAAVVGVDVGHDMQIRATFTVDVRRSYEQDPRFGISVLAEIASRALSPAVNDPGTAIDVIGRGVRVLSMLSRSRPEEPDTEPDCSRIFVPGLDTDDLFDDFFRPIARDGAGLVEVGMRLQKALAALARLDTPGFRQAAIRHSELAITRAEAALSIDDDKQVLRALSLKSAEPLSGNGPGSSCNQRP